MTSRRDSSMAGPGPSTAQPRYEDQTLPDVLRQWAGFARRRVKEILICLVLGGLLSAFYASRVELQYQSELQLIVEPPARSPLETEAAAAAAAESFVEGQVFVIKSTSVLKDVVERLNLDERAYFQPKPDGIVRRTIGQVLALLPLQPDAAPQEDPALDTLDPGVAYAIRALRGRLSVAREGDTEIIAVEMTADSPVLAAEIANAVGTAYVANREKAQFQDASRIAGWLDDRALELQRQLSEAEDAVAAFRIDNNLISGEPGVTLGEQQLTELNGELITTRGLLAERRAAFERASDLMASGGSVQSLPEMQNSELFTTLRTRLLEIERREGELGGAGATNPRLTALREERSVIQSQLDAEVERIIAQLSNEVETLETREALVSEALATAGGETGAASRSNVELRELERRAAAYDALYERYLSNSGLIDESISYLMSGVEVIDAATPEPDSSFPSPKSIILFGLVLGGIVGAGVGLVREAMLPGFMTARQLDRTLGLPVLASIPQLPKGRTGVSMTRDEPMSPFAEAVRTLRHGLTPHRQREGAPIVLMTSSVPAEGKTSLSASLATSAVEAGLNVLLIDADLRRGGLTRAFEAEGSEGLTELLRARGWAFHDLIPGAGELDLLPTGAPVTSPSDLFAGRQMESYLEAARSAYDLIILDGPPIANMADASLLGRLADTIAYVVRWNETPRGVVQEAVLRLGGNSEKIGLALNAVDLDRVAQYGESYGQYVLATQQGRAAV